MGRIRPSFLPRLIFAALDSNKSGAYGVVCSPSHLTAFAQIVYHLSTNKISNSEIILKPASFVRSTFLSPPVALSIYGIPRHGAWKAGWRTAWYSLSCPRYFSISFFIAAKSVVPRRRKGLLPRSLTQYFVCPHSLLNLSFSGFTHIIAGRAVGRGKEYVVFYSTYLSVLHFRWAGTKLSGCFTFLLGCSLWIKAFWCLLSPYSP